MGLSLLSRAAVKRPIAVIYGVLFTGILLIGFGSSYYHYAPNNSSLVWDRIPMTIVFMAFLTAVIAECISIKTGRLLLFHFDKEIYATTGFVSGHSLKHIAAAVATWYMVHAFGKKYGANAPLISK